MTEVEIKEQAREYAIDNYEACIYDEVIGWQNDYKARKQSYLDGAKWGLEHAIKWHDIESHVLPKREIPKKYMPKANEKVMLKYHFYNETEIHYSDGYYDKFDFEFHIPNNPTGKIICVIAWCELPQFKDKE